MKDFLKRNKLQKVFYILYSVWKKTFKTIGMLHRLHNNPEEEAQRNYVHAHCLSCNLTRHGRDSYGPLPQGYCEQKTPKS